MRDLRLATEGKKRPAAAKTALRTRCARACASSASRTRRRSSCSAPPATSPIARSSPRCYHLWRTHLLPHEFTIVALGRRRLHRRDASGTGLRESLANYSRLLPIDLDVCDELCRRVVYHRVRLLRPRRLREPGRAARPDRRGAGDARQPAVLPRDPAVGVRRDRRPAGPGRPRPRAPRGRLATGGHREAVRARPRIGGPAQPRGRQGLPGAAGLPHRPLPGQGDRPQPAGLPVRERHLRAHLEPAPHRPRADHRGGVDGDREPRARSTRRPARRATSSRTTCCSS